MGVFLSLMSFFYKGRCPPLSRFMLKETCNRLKAVSSVAVLCLWFRYGGCGVLTCYSSLVLMVPRKDCASELLHLFSGYLHLLFNASYSMKKKINLSNVQIKLNTIHLATTSQNLISLVFLEDAENVIQTALGSENSCAKANNEHDHHYGQ